MMRALALLCVVGCGGTDPVGVDVTPPGLADAGEPDATPPCGAGVETEAGVVITESGAVRGADLGATWAWKGVRYAEPPTGERRWRAPEPAACAEGVTDAMEFGAICPQLSGGVVEGDEDCLTLNVWAAKDAAAAPVMVFIHGGGNVGGAASQPIYDGAYLAENGAVVVTVQYRLGALGFLAHPALAAESAQGSSGNYAILDLVAALGWVQRNIAAFGGDPANVMIFGESAGGRNVCTLLASPLAAGLFHRAAIQSGGCTTPDRDTAEDVGDEVVDGAGCGTAADIPACLRALTPAEVVAALPAEGNALSSSPFQAHVDGYVLETSPHEALAGGSHHHVPLLIGANADETGQMVPPMTEAEYQAAVNAQYGAALGAAVLDEYPSSDFATPRAAFVALTSDARFICPARRFARAAAMTQDEPVLRYHFTHTLPGMAAVYGAFHGLELPFVFHSLEALTDSPPPGELAFATLMAGTWLDHARGETLWGEDVVMLLDDLFTEAPDVPRAAKCDFWDTLTP